MPDIKADLHIHSCLSPCGDLFMSPALIAEKAAAAGLAAAAVTDHNSALNCRAFETCCRRRGILPVFGMEVTSIEEAHVLCLFGSPDPAEELGRLVYERLPDIPNIPEKFGDQVFVDADENILGEVDKYLVSAAEISLDELLETVHGLGGLFIPAHIDKPVFSIPSQLGFLPDMDYDALETTTIPCPVETSGHVLIRNSDAHYPDDIAGRYTVYRTDDLSFDSIRKALEDGACFQNNKGPL